MQEKIADKLLTLNRRFYDGFAEAFSDSRGASEPGFERIVGQISPGAQVLDLGCGHGRLASLLPPGSTYVGVDSSAEMLKVGEQDLQGSDVDAQFVHADIVRDRWEALLSHAFDWVVLRAVLHHIPGYENRRHVVARAAAVRAPGGRVAMANWQFMQIERLRRRILPWSVIDLSSDDVEPGDYLLDWRRQGYGIRYVHLVDQDETQRLARDTGLAIEQLFRADGHTNDLTLYAILR